MPGSHSFSIFWTGVESYPLFLDYWFLILKSSQSFLLATTTCSLVAMSPSLVWNDKKNLFHFFFFFVFFEFFKFYFSNFRIRIENTYKLSGVNIYYIVFFKYVKPCLSLSRTIWCVIGKILCTTPNTRKDPISLKLLFS